jgi:hypothetical protein
MRAFTSLSRGNYLLTRDICITVDVEDFFLPRPCFDTVFARQGGQDWGIGRIMQALDQYGARGTFYVDVYNRTTLTEALLEDACTRVVRGGHELGLHTHPEFPKGVRGYGMQQVMSSYPFQRQLELVGQGCDWIRRWTGQGPKTHRAGGYGANMDTLAALAACDITSDSSLYAGYPYCELARQAHAVNTCFVQSGVREVPVTTTRNCFGLPLPGGGWLGPQLEMKIDLDWLDLQGLQQQVDAALAETDAPVVIFLHSYSLLDLNKGMRPDTCTLLKLQALLHWLARRGDVVLSTVPEAAARASVHVLPSGCLPECRFNLATQPVRWARYASKAISVDRVRKLLLPRKQTP